MTDAERLEWLDADPNRLEDVRGWLNNSDGDIRDAIDYLVSNSHVIGFERPVQRRPPSRVPLLFSK